MTNTLDVLSPARNGKALLSVRNRYEGKGTKDVINEAKLIRLVPNITGQ